MRFRSVPTASGALPTCRPTRCFHCPPDNSLTLVGRRVRCTGDRRERDAVLEATDQRGPLWRGLLVIYVNGSAREVFIYMATVSA
jgi:hypothetical protein